MANRVPTADEIKRIVERRLSGERQEEAVSREVELVQVENKSLVSHLENLQTQVKALSSRGKMTPQEARENLQLVFAKHDMSPAEELVRMVMEKQDSGSFSLEPDLRARILLDLNQYVMPKLRSVEVSGTVNHEHNVVIVRFGEDGTVRREPAKAPVKALVDVEAVVKEGGSAA